MARRKEAASFKVHPSNVMRAHSCHHCVSNTALVFVEDIDRGVPSFQRPPADILLKIAFERWNVERGWVLLFNCILSTHLSVQEPQNLSQPEAAVEYLACT